MKISQSNYLNMSNAVVTHFDNNVPVWSRIRIIAEGVGRLKTTIADITATATRQSINNPVGHTVAKEQAREGLEDLVYLTALRIRSYAGIAGDEVLLEKMRFSRSALDVLGINDLLTRSRLVLDACTVNLSALTEYQVDQKTADELQGRIDRTAQLYAQRDTVIDRRMEATARLQQLFAQARKNLKTLDDLVEAYVEDDTFVATYFNARRIHDLKGRKMRTEEKK
ncbi:MAG: hypothetical protein LBK96_02430 [Prevotellaceae bacterium]|jgi:hypothetical protein|nr:hypothetical protein [Prevotellaceae bacterium]